MPAVPPMPYLLISSVCTPYLLSILYLPGSPAWQIKLPFLYLHEGNTPVTAETDWHLPFVPAFLRAPGEVIALPLEPHLPGPRAGAPWRDEGTDPGPMSVRRPRKEQLLQNPACRGHPQPATETPQVSSDCVRNTG